MMAEPRKENRIMQEAMKLLNEVVESLALIRWEEIPYEGAVIYQGKGADWIVTVGSYQWSDDTKVYDGTCGKGGTLIHMTPDVAEKVFLYAEKMIA